MDTIVRNVSEMNSDHRRALESVIGHALGEGQQVVISVQNATRPEPSNSTPAGASPLPAWLNLYEGLSDQEIDELEKVILQRDRTMRTFE